MTKDMRYAIIIEKGKRGYSAYVPDLPGCIAAAGTLGQVKQLMRTAIAMHVEDLREQGLPVPSPSSLCEYVTVRAA